MWRNQRTAALLPPIYYCCFTLALLAVLAADRLSSAGTEARIQYTEGGSFGQQLDDSSSGDAGEYDVVDLINSNSIPRQQTAGEAEEENERLAGIVDELQRVRASSSQEEQDQEVEGQGDEPIELVAVPKPSSPSLELEELKKFGAKMRELAASSSSSAGVPAAEEEIIELQQPSSNPVKKEKPLTAQKKGQSEFVEFVEPVHAKLASKKLKNRETLEKRVADYRLSRLHRDKESGVGLLYSSGNMLFIAFVTMCCVLSVVGVVGGAYYYKHVRSINEDPFDDFTRYSPAGPGRDKMKKNFACEKGDETLAYKAQLHHYQQTKQKIIGDGMGGGRGALEDDTSDKSDDEADLEHNFSVYECPGLAPTGDIEVQNPNFVDSAASSPTREQ